MASETNTRIHYLIIRREGYEAKKVRLPSQLQQTQTDLDGLVDPVASNDDFDLLDDATVFTTADQLTGLASYEIHTITQPWEINEIS